MPEWHLTTIRITPGSPRAGDVKRLHDLVIQAALAGEPMRPVLWVSPQPGLLLVRHDRPISARDLPPGWATSVTYSPYWLPPQGAEIEAALVMDASQSARTKAQCEAIDRARVAAGLEPWARRRPSRIRTPLEMVEVLAARLAGMVGPVTVRAVRSWHVVGRRSPDSGGLQHSNQVLLRVAGTVIDAPALHTLMVDGVGRGRSFGCGLILARPARVGAAAC